MLPLPRGGASDQHGGAETRCRCGVACRRAANRPTIVNAIAGRSLPVFLVLVPRRCWQRTNERNRAVLVGVYSFILTWQFYRPAFFFSLSLSLSLSLSPSLPLFHSLPPLYLAIIPLGESQTCNILRTRASQPPRRPADSPTLSLSYLSLFFLPFSLSLSLSSPGTDTRNQRRRRIADDVLPGHAPSASRAAPSKGLKRARTVIAARGVQGTRGGAFLPVSIRHVLSSDFADSTRVIRFPPNVRRADGIFETDR